MYGLEKSYVFKDKSNQEKATCVTHSFNICCLNFTSLGYEQRKTIDQHIYIYDQLMSFSLS